MAASTKTHVSWRKSSHSSGAGNCVEVAFDLATVGVRDSKQPKASHLVVGATTFQSFVHHIKAS